MKPSSQQNIDYLPALDVMRAFAVLAVVVSHAMYEMLPGGWVAVDLFFVISGYLITSILLKEQAVTGTISICHFYFRRALRLLPALTVAIVLANILWPYTHLLYDGKQMLATLSALVYFTNAIKGNVTGNLFHLWSLAVEEHFYMVWPFVMMAIAKWKPASAIKFIVALLVVSTLVKIIYVNAGTIISWRDVYLAPQLFSPFKMDAILCGCLLAFAKDKTWPLRRLQPYLWLLVIPFFAWIIIALSKWNDWYLSGGFLLVNALCTGTIFIAIKSNVKSMAGKNVFIWIGKRSYGLYLYHMPVFMFLDNFHEPHNRLNFAGLFLLKITVAFVLAAVSYRYIEQPFLQLKKRFR